MFTSTRLLVAAGAVVLAVSALGACSTDEPETSRTTPQETTPATAASSSPLPVGGAPADEIAVGERIYDPGMSHGILVVGYVPSFDVSPDFTEDLGGDSVFLVHLRIDAGDRYRSAVASTQFSLGCDQPAFQSRTPLDTDGARAEVTAGGLVPMPQFGVEAGQNANVWMAFSIDGGVEPTGCGLTYSRGEREIVHGGSGTVESFTQTVPLG